MPVTLGDLKSRVYSRLDGNTLLYPAQEVTNSLNEQITMVNLATGLIQSTVAISSIGHKVWYRVPPPILIPLRVQFDDRNLAPDSFETMGEENPRWIRNTTLDTRSSVANWIPLGFKTFAIYPADAKGGALIRITGVSAPPPLRLDQDLSPLTSEYAEMVATLTAQVLQLKESAPMFAQASLYYQEYLSKLKTLKAWRSMVMPTYYVQKSEAQA